MPRSCPAAIAADDISFIFDPASEDSVEIEDPILYKKVVTSQAGVGVVGWRGRGVGGGQKRLGGGVVASQLRFLGFFRASAESAGSSSSFPPPHFSSSVVE